MHDDKVTTPTISTLLLVPAAGDPLGLLAPGAPVYSVRDTLAGWVVDCEVGCAVYAPTEGDGHVHPLAAGDDWHLRLAYDGEPVPEGMDRWYRVLNRAFPRNKYHPPVRWDDTMDEVVLFFRAGHMRSDLGTLLALDPAGRDVTDEVMRGR